MATFLFLFLFSASHLHSVAYCYPFVTVLRFPIFYSSLIIFPFSCCHCISAFCILCQHLLQLQAPLRIVTVEMIRHYRWCYMDDFRVRLDTKWFVVMRLLGDAQTFCNERHDWDRDTCVGAWKRLWWHRDGSSASELIFYFSNIDLPCVRCCKKWGISDALATFKLTFAAS